MTTNLPAIHSHALGGLPAILAIEAGEFNEIEQARVALIDSMRICRAYGQPLPRQARREAGKIFLHTRATKAVLKLRMLMMLHRS